jgi:signal peptidase I
MTFNKNGYEVIKQFIEKDFVEFTQDYFSLKINSGDMDLDDPQAKGNYTWYGDPLIETILQNSCEPIGNIIGVKIVPTYCFTRLYNKGDVLKKHLDRSSCEISATLSLGYSDDSSPNPICFSNNIDEIVEIYLEPGDLCVYRGCDLYHWRPPIQNTWLLQSFLHFVDGEGQYKNFIYDGREYLGFPKVSE